MYYPYYFDLEEVLSQGLNVASDLSFVNVLLVAFKLVVAYLVLEKAGERGWKSLIPFYNDYLEYKLYWNKNLYWLNLFMPTIAIICIIVGSAMYENLLVLGVCFVLGTILIIISAIFDIKLKIKKGKCFGEPTLFGVGLVLLNTIFCAILAFDKKCQYVGKQTEVNEEPIEENNQENL